MGAVNGLLNATQGGNAAAGGDQSFEQVLQQHLGEIGASAAMGILSMNDDNKKDLDETLDQMA